MKIAVLGYSGAGKSTLARALASALDIPCLHLDQVHWLPGWTERAREESRQMVKDFLDQNSSWVIDGNYKSFCYEQRLEQADHIVFLNFPRLRCLWRAWRRSIRYRDRTREDMGEGCVEKFDWEFIRWILWEGRRKPLDLSRHGAKLTVCGNARDVTRFLSSLTQ